MQKNDQNMLILNTGMPRAATTWVFNVISNILKNRNIVFNKSNLNESALVRETLNNYDWNETFLAHFHDIVPEVIDITKKDNVKIIYNYRDPRDIVVSLMKLHGGSFDSVLDKTIMSCRHFMKAIKINGLFLIPYYSVINHPQSVIFSIAFHLGHVICLREVNDICEQTSISKHKDIMKNVINNQEQANSIFTGSRDVKYDHETLINDRHIQSGETGRWKNELSSQQQETVNNVFGDFVNKYI